MDPNFHSKAEPNPDAILLTAKPHSPQNPSDILKGDPDFRKCIEPYEPITTCAAIAGLLTEPSLLANNLRLELLIHLVLAWACGTKSPSAKCLESWLNEMLAKSGALHFEDPVQDVFLSNVTTKNGDFRIFRGTWESSDFYLQRLLNVIDALPDSSEARNLHLHVTAFLRVTEEIARRRELKRFSLGGGQNQGAIRLSSIKGWKRLQASIAFTIDDFSTLGISDKDLAPFVLPSGDHASLQDQTFHDSILTRKPILRAGANYYVILPTAISIALRFYILDWMLTYGHQQNFDRHLATEYSDLFSRMPAFGSPVPVGTSFPLYRVGSWTILDFVKEVDDGRHVHILAVVESISDYARFGFFDHGHNPLELSAIIERQVNEVRSHFEQTPGFKKGLTLVVGCGLGRPMTVLIPPQPPSWTVEFVLAQDLETIAWHLPEQPLLLWKMLEHEKLLLEHNVSIINTNGLLNLYGWWLDTDHFMVPAEVEFRNSSVELAIPLDSLTRVRQEVRQGLDVHSASLPDGKKQAVLRLPSKCYFEDDKQEPRYACVGPPSANGLIGLYEGNSSAWWLRGDASRSRLNPSGIFQVWNAVYSWLDRVVPVLEKHVTEIYRRSLLIVLDMNELHQDQVTPLRVEGINSCLSASVKHSEMMIRITLRDPFIGAFVRPENVAERALIQVLVQGVFALADRVPCPQLLDQVVQAIVPNDDARYFHVFEAKQFHEYICSLDRPLPLFIEDADVARAKLGLGWLAQQKAAKSTFMNAVESVKFLNKTVDVVWQRMRTRLKSLNRVSLIERCLRFLEGLVIEQRRWERTFRAICALYDDKPETSQIAHPQIFRVNAAAIAHRIVVEMALPECPLKGGGNAGSLDVSPLISDAGLLFQLGGCSDAIYKGVMKPEVEVVPSGDILTDTGFRKQITERLGKRFESVRLADHAEHYSELYAPFKPMPDAEQDFPEQFVAAFTDEFGVSLNELRNVRDTLEDLAIEHKKCVFLIREVDLFAAYSKKEGTSAETLQNVLTHFSLSPRKAWDSTPPGFKDKDWFPWRFGRRLSLVARPLIRLENSSNPRYMISPGLFAESIPYIVRRYYDAEVDTSECETETMKTWIDGQRNRRGDLFEADVCLIMHVAGYQTLAGQTIGGLTGERTDRDMGDVDVLAWKPEEDEVWAIECKCLRLARTPNEMAEQLNMFSGRVLPDNTRDYLLKHLDRCNELQERREKLATRLGISKNALRIRSVVCFSNPVPMEYVSERFPEVLFVTVDDLPAHFPSSNT